MPKIQRSDVKTCSVELCVQNKTVIHARQYGGEKIAVKTVNFERVGGERKARREAIISSRVRHRNCARFIGVVSESEIGNYELAFELLGLQLTKVCELISQSEKSNFVAYCWLHEHDYKKSTCVSNGGRLVERRMPFAFVKRYALDVARGLDYLHSVGVYHRDLGGHNVCLTLDASRAVIIDFGRCCDKRRFVCFCFCFCFCLFVFVWFLIISVLIIACSYFQRKRQRRQRNQRRADS